MLGIRVPRILTVCVVTWPLVGCAPSHGDATTRGVGSDSLTSAGGTTGGTATTFGTGSDTGSGAATGPSLDVGASAGSTTGPANCESTIPVTIRDFHASHPDFESYIGEDPGIVLPDLGPDGKPVYAGQAGNPSTTGQANFDQWYRDVPGVNQTIPWSLDLVEIAPGTWGFDDQEFFPIDDQGFGNEGNPHNYHFTLELHSTFVYGGGEVFTFRGDDDLFLFLNGKLAIDLGGVHGPLEATVDLDAQAAALGLSPGGTYDFDLFFAERHTTQSSFRIETTISCFVPPG
ncbi:MAG: fibro-slime domain-containing protein [Deltaproteobacteria bacterium]|nr:MAG: fibro-slime domain-containing protein [Deltaproteobacteria bacterium]